MTAHITGIQLWPSWGHADKKLFLSDLSVIMVHVHANVLYFRSRRLQEIGNGKKCKKECVIFTYITLYNFIFKHDVRDITHFK